MITEKNVRPTGRRVQFRLRSLFGLVTAAGIALGLAGYADHRLSDEARAVRELRMVADRVNKQRGAKSECGDYPHDGVWDRSSSRRVWGWDLRQICPEYMSVLGLEVYGEAPAAKAARELGRFPRLCQLTLEETSLADADLRLLSGMTGLKELRVTSTQLDGSFVRSLPGNTPLDGLHISSPQVSDDGFAAICELRSLKSLGVGRFQIRQPETLRRIDQLKSLKSLTLYGEYDPSGLKALGSLNELRSLSLGCSRACLNDAAIENVCRCVALDSLRLSDLSLAGPATLYRLRKLTQLFDLELEGEFPNEGLEALAELDGLDMLNLSSHSLTNDGVSRLSESPSITYLTLASDRIDDRCIDSLAKMPALQQVYLHGTQVSRQGIARLKSLRPGLSVNN